MSAGTIQDREVVKSVREIVMDFMGLADSQIMLAYQKFDIPPSKGIYLTLSYVGGKAIGNNSYFDGATNAEVVETTMHELVQIDVMSFDSSARTRKEEVIAALRSTKSMQVQERDNISIGRIPGDFINASSLEETQFLNRFTMTIAVTALSRIVKQTDYFSNFGGEFEADASEPVEFSPTDSNPGG